MITSPSTGHERRARHDDRSRSAASRSRATTNTAVNTTAGGSGDASKTWVDANIKITPATATNAVNTNHTLTITVAPVHRHDRRGHLHGDRLDRRRQRRLASSAASTRAPTRRRARPAPSSSPPRRPARRRSRRRRRVTVSGQSITRDDRHRGEHERGGSGDASKTWVDANIRITPATATNAVGTNHTLTITVAGGERDDRRRHLHGDRLDRRATRRLASSAAPTRAPTRPRARAAPS